MRFSLFQRPAHKAAGEVSPSVVPDAAPAEIADGPASRGYVIFAPLLDPQKQVLGYRMDWRAADDGPPGAGPAAEPNALAALVAEHFTSAEAGWLMGKTTLFLDVAMPALLHADFRSLPPENVVLCIAPDDLLAPEAGPAIESLRRQGFGFMLCGAPALPEDPGVRDFLTHFDVGAGAQDAIAALRHAQPPGRTAIQPIATQMAAWSDFDAVAARRVPIFVPGTCVRPPVTHPGRALQPEALLIVRVMQMIQRNEDVRDIEAALKHDAALSYRLLRHINSPAIGAGIEIHSLRHAVSMLGYSPLFRWLSLLLATSNTKSSPPFLMKKAIMRGRFVELLGQALLDASDADNLFVAGMFSMIDQLLGVPMEEVLGRIQLTEGVQKAILARGGIYGPFLALAETCEADAAEAARLSNELFMAASQVNAAHLSAMVWAQEVSPGDAAY
jgi:c-di-GMP-related signal transduction protein